MHFPDMNYGTQKTKLCCHGAFAVQCVSFRTFLEHLCTPVSTLLCLASFYVLSEYGYYVRKLKQVEKRY
jgi:hypothetical protein